MERLMARPDLLLVTLATLLVIAHALETQFCQNEVFRAECGESQVIVIDSAVYGRMSFSRCIERDYGYVGQCQEDVRHLADAMCSGRRKCEITIPNSEFDAKRPCPKDLKSYLEIHYHCLNVKSPVGLVCRDGDYVQVSAQTGVIASVMTEEKSLGDAACPWLIKALPGQKVNVSLVDFAVTPGVGETCHAYAIIRERIPSRTQTICSGEQRERHVYLSASESVEIRVLTIQKSARQRYFLLKYDVIGCGDPHSPVGGWMKREGNVATLGCSGTDFEWRLTCKGNKWHGAINNCSQAGSVAGEVRWGGTSLPFGVSIIMIIGIALAIGIAILIVGLFILRQRRRQNVPNKKPQGQNTYHGEGYGPHPIPPIKPDQESLYATENEYAYISDIPLSPPPMPNTPNKDVYFSIKRQTSNPGNQYSGYGTTAAQFNVKQHTGAHGLPIAEMSRYGDPGRPLPDPTCEDPPKYFELDPSVAKPGDSSKGYRDSRGRPYYPHPVPMVDPVMIFNPNKALHDFQTSNPYDIGLECRNNKSV